ncbi:MAG TPA: hypothetical protein VEZ11_06110 [Thermoanaerobaculia bacterium]|nr:hypothetical protein [Thermoanaerobaculia bacterium]
MTLAVIADVNGGAGAIDLGDAYTGGAGGGALGGDGGESTISLPGPAGTAGGVGFAISDVVANPETFVFRP